MDQVEGDPPFALQLLQQSLAPILLDMSVLTTASEAFQADGLSMSCMD
jgi:hypothetical protein